jgi:hypothetical protein
MRVEKGLSPDAGRGADAGFRKSLLMPSPPWTRVGVETRFAWIFG